MDEAEAILYHTTSDYCYTLSRNRHGLYQFNVQLDGYTVNTD